VEKETYIKGSTSDAATGPKTQKNATLVLLLGTGTILLVAFGIVFLTLNYKNFITSQDFYTTNGYLYTYFLNKTNWNIITSNWTCGSTNITIEFLEPTFNGLNFTKSSGATYGKNATCVRRTK
jgi:hypothetical protein